MFQVSRIRYTLRFVELLDLFRQPRKPFKARIAVQTPLILHPRQHFFMRKFDETPINIVHEMEIQVAAMHERSKGFPGGGQRDNVLPTFAVVLFVLLRCGDVRLTGHGDNGGDEIWILQVLR